MGFFIDFNKTTKFTIKNAYYQAQTASFLRFIAAYLSLTQFVTWERLNKKYNA